MATAGLLNILKPKYMLELVAMDFTFVLNIVYNLQGPSYYIYKWYLPIHRGLNRKSVSTARPS